MAGKTKIQVKGKIKSYPSNKKKPIKPKFRELHGGLLTDKIIVTVKKEKAKNESNNKEDNK